MPFFLVLCLGTGFCSDVVAQARIPRTQIFSEVYYQYPAQFFRNGVKSGFEFNVNDRYVLGVRFQNTLTYFPTFFDPPDLSNGISSFQVDVTENYKTEGNMELSFKNYIGRRGYSFHGTYVSLFAQTGLGRETYYTQIAPGFPKNYQVNSYRFNRIGVLFGQDITLFNQGVWDVNFGVGYTHLAEGHEVLYTAVPPFTRFDNAPYFVMNMGFGIGKPKYDQRLPRKPALRDSLELDYALTLDLNAIVQNGVELSGYFGNRDKRLLRAYGRYRTNRSGGINISSADSFQSYLLGFEYRYYPTASAFRNGMYLGAGYAYEHAMNVFRWNEFTPDGEFLEFEKMEHYDPHHLNLTLGFTTILQYQYMVEAYISNILTISKGNNGGEFGRVGEATGLRTVAGVKFGLARFRGK